MFRSSTEEIRMESEYMDMRRKGVDLGFGFRRLGVRVGIRY